MLGGGDGMFGHDTPHPHPNYRGPPFTPRGLNHPQSSSPRRSLSLAPMPNTMSNVRTMLDCHSEGRGFDFDQRVDRMGLPISRFKLTIFGLKTVLPRWVCGSFSTPPLHTSDSRRPRQCFGPDPLHQSQPLARGPEGPAAPQHLALALRPGPTERGPGRPHRRDAYRSSQAPGPCRLGPWGTGQCRLVHCRGRNAAAAGTAAGGPPQSPRGGRFRSRKHRRARVAARATRAVRCSAAVGAAAARWAVARPAVRSLRAAEPQRQRGPCGGDRGSRGYWAPTRTAEAPAKGRSSGLCRGGVAWGRALQRGTSTGTTRVLGGGPMHRRWPWQ